MGVSYQKGWVRVRGKKWYGYFRRTVLDERTGEPKLITNPVILGLKTEMSKFQAREKLELEIAKLGGQSNNDQSMINGAVTFGWFVRNRYLPLKEADWREETAKVKKHLIQADLVNEFEEVRLENFEKFTLQNHLNRLAKMHSKDRVLQIRSYMRAIFAEAVDQDFLTKDPARSVKVPANLRAVDKTTLTWDQLGAALDKLGDIGLRDWVLMKLDMSNALRPSEVFPLRWRCLLEDENILDIQETIYKGNIRPFGKTKGSLTQVPIAEVLTKELLEYREECRKNKIDVSADAFMFPGRFGGPMDSSNYRHRVLHKLAEELELPKLTFQVIRRTIATLAPGHIKGIQGMMRHTKASTTTDIYMQSLEPEVRSTVNSIHRELSRKSGRPDPGRPSEKRGLRDSPNDSTRTTAKQALEIPATERVPAKPVRGVVLEFAAKMRPSRGREVLLNA